jgi:hypothetical protein
MSELERLLAAYIAEHRSGGKADPRAYLGRAPRGERRLLAALIDAYLARAPRAPFAQAALSRSGAQRAVDELERALAGEAGLWPAVLPALRHRAGLKRAELVERLAHALGVGGRRAKVADYYHQMEQGRLPAAGVSNRVLEALAAILGESAQALREAGETLRPASGPAGRRAPGAAPAFARRASGEPAPPGGSPNPRSEEEWDEVDELFRGSAPGR